MPCHNSETVRNHEISNASWLDSTLIQNLVREAQAKLAQLQAQKERICSRMQALRYLSLHSRGSNRRNEADLLSRTAPLSHTTSKSAKPTRDQPYSVDVQSRLRRACRIALLESDEPQSAAEIYQRIQKRGSISFEDREKVTQMLTAQLNSMTASDEILCIVVNGEMRWKSKVLEETET